MSEVKDSRPVASAACSTSSKPGSKNGVPPEASSSTFGASTSMPTTS